MAAALGVMVGVLCIAGGLLRLGFVANFLSKSVIVGFMHGIALIIIVSQLPERLLGDLLAKQIAQSFAIFVLLATHPLYLVLSGRLIGVVAKSNSVDADDEHPPV